MADVLDYVSGAPFVFRVRSSLTANPRARWFNTWEARATRNGTIDDLNALSTTIVGFMYQLYYTYATIDQITVSTWEPDSHPYNPLGFATTVFNQVGSKSMLGEVAVSLRQTLFLKRTVSSGLLGKLFLRGCLVKDDITSVDGEWSLVDLAALQAEVHSVALSTGLSNYMLGLAGEAFGLALIGDDEETRWITSLDVGGTSDVKLNHKYFDRTPAP